MAYKTSTIFNRLKILEREFQKLKIEAFFALPEKKQKCIYPEKSLKKSIRDSRKSIWKEYYTKKM